jgi:hydrogenase-4 component B
MTALGFLLLSLLLFCGGALICLCSSRAEGFSIGIASLSGVLGSLAGLAGSIPVLISGQIQHFAIDGPFSFARIVVRMDLLAALMVFVISLLALITSLYSQAYVQEYRGRGAWLMGFFMNLFVASMLALVLIDNAFYFLILFEAMSLSSYFLVIFDQDEEAVKAGFLYFLIAHGGSILIMAAFWLLYRESGSLDFDSFRRLHLTGPLASTVFLLGFFGFGAKAGIIPLHSWLPRAHPAAPSHASAMMSGIMVKIGVYGILKVGIDLLGASGSWWGMLVLAFGAVSAVLGVLYALAESDIKRLLAYSTVENVGIILMGVGVGMLGIAGGHPLLAALGLLAALYHLLNHAVFKGLLFLGAGSIIYRTHTRDMQQLGGLGKSMPYTALTFLVGALAICALPPLNGFVSEWYTYQALFGLAKSGSVIAKIAGPMAMVMLALTGALAAMCFVKAYGITFSALPRSAHASHAREVPMLMVIPMVVLAAAIVVLGLWASSVAPVMARVAASLTGGVPLAASQNGILQPGGLTQTSVSTPLVAWLLVAIPVIPVVLLSVLRGVRLKRRHMGDAWACGYTQEATMTVSANGFGQPVEFMFARLFNLREQCSVSAGLDRSLTQTTAAATRIEPMLDMNVLAPLVRAAQKVGTFIQRLQHGDFRLYCLYVVIALVILLLTAR